MLPNILSLAFDEELDKMAEDILTSHGIKVNTGVGVKKILGDVKKVTGVQLNSGEKIDTDAVILSMWYEPNSKLAKSAGLKVKGKDGYNQYLEELWLYEGSDGFVSDGYDSLDLQIELELNSELEHLSVDFF